MTELTEMVGVVAPRTAFPTVDEMEAFARDLAARHRMAQVRTIGTSRGGDPIQVIEVGSGPRPVIVVGNPHPNEPIGMATIQHLATRLCESPELVDELETTWHFVPCLDPDGTRLNEGWYGGPISRANVARHFYRPPADEQAEWTFPVTWGGKQFNSPIPETQALMRLIDETRPTLIASLHNADFGGGFFYVTGGDQTYWSALTSLLDQAGVPLEGGLPDMPGARQLSTAVFEMAAFATMYDVVAAVAPKAVDSFTGGSSRDYAAKYGSSVLICELPLWTDPRAADGSPASMSFGDLMNTAAEAHRDSAALFSSVLTGLAGRLDEHSPFYRAVTGLVPDVAAFADAKSAVATSDADRPATRAEQFMELHGWPETIRLRLGGMMLRLLDDTIHARGPVPIVVSERARLAESFDRWCAEVMRHRPGQLIPIDRLVGIQAGAILLAVTRGRDGLPT